MGFCNGSFKVAAGGLPRGDRSNLEPISLSKKGALSSQTWFGRTVATVWWQTWLFFGFFLGRFPLKLSQWRQMYSRLNGPRCLTWREPGLCMRPFASLFADWPRGSRGCFTGEPKGLKGSDAEHRSPQVYGKGDPDCLTSTLSCLSYLNLWVSKMHKSRFRRSNGCVGSLGTTAGNYPS